MSVEIHPTAVVSPDAVLGEGVGISPYAIVGGGVHLGAGCVVGPHCTLEGEVTIGRDCRIWGHVSIGSEPQDLKYRGEPTRVEIGEGNLFREFVTVNRGTVGGSGVTRIGDHNLFMAYAHVAHDCQVGSRTIFANAATLAGHVAVGDHATVGAFSGVHQFCRVGRHAFIGGYSVITQDALPFVKSVGNRASAYGINTIGLQRKGLSAEAIGALKRAYRLLLQSGLNTTQALERIQVEIRGCQEVDELLEFIKTSKRGIVK